MKGIFRVGTAAYLALMSYLIINLFFGPGGVISFNELKEYQVTIKQNINELENINRRLVLASERLIEDSEEIKTIARELGWLEENEGIIVVKGFRNKKTGYAMGRLLSRELSDKKSDTVYKLIAILIALSFYFSTGFISRKHEKTGII